jgi:hypothetical protein
MSDKSNKRLTEGALSALTTPSTPPAQTKLVPLGATQNNPPKKAKP